jgi:DNA primase
MSSNILLGFIENVLGKSHKRARENYAFTCPKCNHQKPKLEVNLHTNEKGENPFECWVCGFKGRTIKSLLKQLQVPAEQAYEILKYVRKGDEVGYATTTCVELPKEFQPLHNASPTSIIANKVKNYLYKRGLTDIDFLKYNIGYCTSGQYTGRIIVPSYNANNQLNFFVARTFEDAYHKYRNPEASKDIIGFENLINWNMPIILVEGVFDAIAVKRNAVPILGKSLSNSLIKKIVSSEAEDIYIALDRDAIKKALQYVEQFLNMGKKVYLVDMEEKDPSEMGFRNFTKHIQLSEEMNFGKLLKYKLS